MAPTTRTATLRRRQSTAPVTKPEPLPSNAQEADRKPRNGQVSKLVLEYAVKHTGVLLHINEIVEATGLDAKQIRAAIRKMAEDGSAGNWEVNLRGSAWTYTPKRSRPEGEWILVEIVATIKDTDNKLVRAEDGSLAVLKPITL